MQTVLIVIHLLIVLALVVVVLLQRSEGGALGIGGGGGGGMMTARGAANALTRATAILATGFFITSMALAILARYGGDGTDILDRIPGAPAGTSAPATGGGSLLDQLGGLPEEEEAPAPIDVPAGGAPATQSQPASPAPTPAPEANAPAQDEGVPVGGSPEPAQPSNQQTAPAQ
ncbi:preprotein translocase subunit SecG [Aureimonas mangrovi]|uniref:preprotein translocase subunit SecG n=1 Tax=Aureimonas mangrovi TaxID=2758041 RepID=UPI00163D74F1|nr:preprotein translocase subunit SecG [Aureimonas mangrovi]